MTMPIPQNSPFKGSDLVVYREGSCSPMPLNGIGEKAFAEIEKFYRDLVAGKTRFKFQKKIGHLALKDFKTLLTRPMGRKLLLTIMAHKGFKRVDVLFGEKAMAVEVVPGYPGFLYDPKGLTERGMYMLTQNLRLFKERTYMAAAHELIHILNGEQGKARLKHNPTEGTIYTNKEEQIVITGKGAPKNYHGITGNGIRKEHGLPERYGHYGVWGDSKEFARQVARNGNVQLLMECSKEQLWDFDVMINVVGNDQLKVLWYLEARGINHPKWKVYRAAWLFNAQSIFSYFNETRGASMEWLYSRHSKK